MGRKGQRSERNICVSNGIYGGRKLFPQKEEQEFHAIKENLVLVYNDSLTAKRGVSLLANLQLAYDYYYEVFGRRGPGGSGQVLYGLADYYDSLKTEGGTVTLDADDPLAKETFPVVVVGAGTDEDGFSRCADEKVIAHEYNHAVVKYMSDFSDGALEEGLADIFAEFSYWHSHGGAEDCSWQNAARNIAHADTDPELITSMSEYEKGVTDAHNASALVSYPAYLMNTDPQRRIGVETLEQLYYIAIAISPPDTDLESFSDMLEKVAVRMNQYGELTDAQLECVMDSLAYTSEENQMDSRQAKEDDAPGQREYWIVFREGWRDDRIEMSTVDSPLPKDELFIVQRGTVLELNNQEGMSTCSQYYLNENGTWEYMREWEKLSHHARSIIASNLDVYDENGNLIVKASDERTY